MNNLLKLFGDEFTPENVCFWSGAGISANYPANLPLGNTFTKYFVDTFCSDGTWEKICEYFKKADMKDALNHPKTSPRFEAVLESIINVYGLDSLKPLEPLYYTPPNTNHIFFAKHLSLNGNHVTTNFDNCIQNGARLFGFHDEIQIIDDTFKADALTKSRNFLLHIHGRYLPGYTNISELGLRVSKVANGILSPYDNLLNKIVTETRYLIFLGYSGSDYFDINPFFYNLKTNGLDLRNLNVVWVNHNFSETYSEEPLWKEKSMNGSTILNGIQEAGGTVKYLEINTNKFIEQIAKTWGLQPLDNIKSSKASIDIKDEFAKQKVTLEQKIISSVNLFSTMGIGKEVIAQKKNLIPLIPKNKNATFLLSNGLRDTGLYNQAIYFSRKLPKTDASDIIFREGRLAGDYWLKGDYFLAGFHFLKGQLIFNIKVKDLEKLRVGVYEELLLDSLHWFRDIKRRNSVFGKLMPIAIAAQNFKFLIDHPNYLFVKPHSIGKLANLIIEIKSLDKLVNIPQWPMLQSSNTVSIFQETDSVLGVINFTRKKLLFDFLYSKILPSHQELEELLNMSILIEDRAGFLKTSTFLLNLHKIKDKRSISVLKEIEWTLSKKNEWLKEWTGS